MLNIQVILRPITWRKYLWFTSMEPIRFWFLFLLFSFTEQTAVQWDVCPPWLVTDNRSIALDVPAMNTLDQLSHAVMNFHYCFLLTEWPTTVQLRLRSLDLVHIAHYKPACIQHVFHIFSCHASNVSLLTEFKCGPLNQQLGHGYGSCTISWTFSAWWWTST